jgi:hypothetical protein
MVLMATHESASAVARGILESVNEQTDMLVLGIPGTDYQLHLVATVAVNQITTPIGKRLKGVIHAKALRLFKASAGGQFIEPVIGQPRIVAGLVTAVDQANRRVLVETPAPMWLTVEDDQSADLFKVGEMVNCYVQSGTTFTPA